MNDKDIFEEIKKFPESQEANPELVKNAIAVAKKNDINKRGSKLRSLKIISLIVACCVLVAAVAVPLIINVVNKQQPRFCNEDEIGAAVIDSMPDYLTENGWNYHCFNVVSPVQSASKFFLRETGEIIYLTQDFVSIDINGEFKDILKLYIVPTNMRFSELAPYEKFDSKTNYGSIKVQYTQTRNESVFDTAARFKVDRVTYILVIKSDTEGMLNTYLAELFG